MCLSYFVIFSVPKKSISNLSELSPFLNLYTVVEMILFVPKLYSDGPSSEPLSWAQLPICCENLVSKGAK